MPRRKSAMAQMKQDRLIPNLIASVQAREQRADGSAARRVTQQMNTDHLRPQCFKLTEHTGLPPVTGAVHRSLRERKPDDKLLTENSKEFAAQVHCFHFTCTAQFVKGKRREQ